MPYFMPAPPAASDAISTAPAGKSQQGHGVAAPQPNRICESGELGVTQNGGIFRRETRRGNMRYSIAAALLIALATGSAMAQPVPVPQFGLPTPSVFSSKIGFFTPDRIEGA